MIDNDSGAFPLNWPMEWWPVNKRKEFPIRDNCWWRGSERCSRDFSFPYDVWDMLKLSIVVLSAFILAFCISYFVCRYLKVNHAFKKSLICASIVSVLSAIIRVILWELL